jgi:hypothetical protein
LLCWRADSRRRRCSVWVHRARRRTVRELPQRSSEFNPIARTKAVLIFRQECNATVPDSMYASLAPTNRPFSTDRGHAFLGFVGRAEVLSNWRKDDAVEVALIPGTGTFIKREERVDNIEVDYK